MIRNHVAKALLITLLLGGLLSGGIAIVFAEEGSNPKVAVSSKSPDNKSEVFGEITLMEPDDQELFIYNGILNKRKLLVKLPFRYEPEITWHGNGIVEVLIGTGSPGRFSIFYDLKNDIVSEPMWFVLAFDKKRNLAVLGEEEIRVVSVFDNRDLLTVKRDDFENTAIKFQIVDQAEFDEQGNLHLLYRNNSQGKSEAVIDSKEFDK